MFKVEHHFIYGWDDAGWTDGDGTPPVFITEEEARQELDDFINNYERAVLAGDMASGYAREDRLRSSNRSLIRRSRSRNLNARST